MARHVIRVYIEPIHSKLMNEALNDERFRFIEEKLLLVSIHSFFKGPFIVQMLHIPALSTSKISTMT